MTIKIVQIALGDPPRKRLCSQSKVKSCSNFKLQFNSRFDNSNESVVARNNPSFSVVCMENSKVKSDVDVQVLFTER